MDGAATFSGKESPGTRHAGGWIALGGCLLIASLLSSRTHWAGVSSATDQTRLPSPRTAVQLNNTAEAHSTLASKSGLADRRGGVVDRFPDFQIDVNRANAAELSAVPGVGPKLAQKIVDYRSEHGPFTSLQELEQIAGVGPRTALVLGQSLIVAESKSAMIDRE